MVRAARCIGFALLGLLTWLAPASAADQPADEVAARVNGVVISRRTVREVVQGLATAQDQPPDAKQVEQLTRDALDSLIAFELLHQESQRRGVAVTDAEIDANVAQTKARFANGDAYGQALAARGMSADDLRAETRKTLAVNRLLEQTAWQNLAISSEQIRNFYEQNREQFKRPAEIRASHILIRAGKDAAAADRAKARQTATDILTQAKGGADFADLARKFSQDPASAKKGGDLGFFARGTMEPTFEQAAFALKRGAISDVVQTPYGFHIITVTDARAAGYAALNEVQDDITALLRDEEKRQRQDQFVAALRKQANVEILPLLKPTPKKP
ncbi:MAG TPA: peptidylprolyl isomerase [Candidatus Kryptonia bacterium]|nr:peptidylprolyl isomerase [Candidatus Kryptonia bacterium]